MRKPSRPGAGWDISASAVLSALRKDSPVFREWRLGRAFRAQAEAAVDAASARLETLDNEIERGAQAVLSDLRRLPASPPSCPDCGSAMVRRVAKRKPYEGNVFWGCSRYPACRGLRAAA